MAVVQLGNKYLDRFREVFGDHNFIKELDAVNSNESIGIKVDGFPGVGGLHRDEYGDAEVVALDREDTRRIVVGNNQEAFSHFTPGLLLRAIEVLGIEPQEAVNHLLTHRENNQFPVFLERSGTYVIVCPYIAAGGPRRFSDEEWRKLEEAPNPFTDSDIEAITDVPGVGASTVTAFKNEGFFYVEQVRNASVKELCGVKGIGEKTGKRIKQEVAL